MGWPRPGHRRQRALRPEADSKRAEGSSGLVFSVRPRVFDSADELLVSTSNTATVPFFSSLVPASPAADRHASSTVGAEAGLALSDRAEPSGADLFAYDVPATISAAGIPTSRGRPTRCLNRPRRTVCQPGDSQAQRKRQRAYTNELTCLLMEVHLRVAQSKARGLLS